MLLITKILVLLFGISKVNGSKNVCDKDCISDVMLGNKNNLSVPKHSDHNITVFSSVFNMDQPANDSFVSDYDDLPHDIVPAISNYERGTRNDNLEVMRKWNFVASFIGKQ